MKLIVALVVLFAVVTLADDVPAGSIKCHDLKTNHQWSIGEDYNPIGQCVTMKCLERGSILGKTCPEEEAIGCEKLPQDLSKPYPECCPKFDCA